MCIAPTLVNFSLFLSNFALWNLIWDHINAMVAFQKICCTCCAEKRVSLCLSFAIFHNFNIVVQTQDWKVCTVR